MSALASSTLTASVPKGDGAFISEFKADSLNKSGSSLSEGGFCDNNNANDNDDSFPPPVQVPEGAPPAAPNIVDGPCWSTREKKPIDRFVPGANNIRDSCPNYV